MVQAKFITWALEPEVAIGPSQSFGSYELMSLCLKTPNP